MNRARSDPAIAFSGRALDCMRGDRWVFSGLEFALGAGDVLVLSGPNGSGKSSLLRIMAGLLAPVSGAVQWHGADIADDRDAHAARLHYVGHLDAVKLALTVAENLRFWAALRGERDGIDRALDEFGLAPLADLPARFLSAGQRRRLALARIAASAAPLWLLDEPTVALDGEGVAAVHAAIRAHCAGGGCCVVSTNTALDLAGAAALDVGRYAAGPAVRP
ncbi:MAG: heme ABC exporter ATP-binding protein CcmA [Defluviicoccus sp.]|nr:heme ABC exporter ATP-binding protein CcmA [Defluviicoccus sp.]